MNKRFLNKVKYNLKSICLYQLVFLFLFFMIFYVSFNFSNQFVPLIHYMDSIENDDVYIYSPSSSIKRYIDDDMINESSLYIYDYILIDGTYYNIMYINSNALNTGLVIPINNNLFVFDILDKNLVENVMYSNKQNLCTGEVAYSNYFQDFTINNVLFHQNVNVDFLMIDNEKFEEITNSSVIIFPNSISKFENISIFNNFYENEFIASGLAIKENTIRIYKSIITLIILLSLIPLIASIFSINNFVGYYIRKNRDDILISSLYGLRFRKALVLNVIEVFIIGFIPSMIGLIVAFLVINPNYSLLIQVGLPICVIFIFLSSYFIVKKELKGIYKSNAWREIQWLKYKI